MESGASASAQRRHLAAGADELLEERVAHRLEVEPVLRDQLACLDDDVVDVPDQLEPLVEILAAQAQPLTKDLHEVDDLEASPIPDIAQLAMAGVVDRGQCRYPGIGDRCELARGELALEGRQYREAVGLGPDTRHIDLDQLDAGDDREEPTNRRLHRRQDRPLVQRHTLLDTVPHQPGERLGMVGEKHQKRIEIERPHAKPGLIARQCHFADLHLTARAPRQHRGSPGRGEPVDRRVADPRGIVEIAFAELVDAAALPRATHDLVVDAEKVEGVEAQKRDVRGLQDIAAGIEDHIRRVPARRRGLSSNACQGLGRQLQPRQDTHPRLIFWKPWRQRALSGASPVWRRAKPRASCTMSRGLIPCWHAGMQLPLPLHTDAQRIASVVPLPPEIKSTMPAAVSVASACPRPAGPTMGQARKQSPQRVQASAIPSPRARKSSTYPAAELLLLMLTPRVCQPKLTRKPPE